jgi:hypothetical protein
VVNAITDTGSNTNHLADVVRSLENLGSDVRWREFRTVLLLAPGPMEVESDMLDSYVRTGMTNAPPINATRNGNSDPFANSHNYASSFCLGVKKKANIVVIVT